MMIYLCLVVHVK